MTTPIHAGPYMTEPERTDSMPKGPEREGRQLVENAPELAAIRDLPERLHSIAAPIALEKERLYSDPNLTEEGRDRLIREQDEKLREAIASSMADRDRQLKALAARFPNTEPPRLSIQPTDAARIQVILFQLPLLSPSEVVARLGEAVTRSDRVLVQEVLPVIRSLVERGFFEPLTKDRPISEGDPAKSVIADAEALLVGSGTHAGRYARLVVPRVEAETERVIRAVVEEGRWYGSQAERVRGDVGGRPVRNLVWLRDGTEEGEG